MPPGLLQRFRVQVERRSSGRVLDIGARDLDELPAYQYLSHLALVDAGSEIRETRLPLPAEKSDASPDDLPFPDRSFDVVVCRFVLHRAEDPARVASEIARVLRRTGQLLFVDIAGGVNGLDVLTHLRLGGLVTHDVDSSRPRGNPRSTLVQGIAAHLPPQYVREFAWLSGGARTGEHHDAESRGLQENT
ncbi:class I SAM-dependent methyltransferase [Saccharopolyspora rhizosphaerae]|nr:class I SAM-dependent methyltransferase [Saccharopolyspora rhizosphaerae]